MSEIRVTLKDILFAILSLIIVSLISIIFFLLLFFLFSSPFGFILGALGFWSIFVFATIGLGFLSFWYIIYSFLKEFFDKKEDSDSSRDFTLDRIKEAK
jgi:hypothetical protein